MRARCWTAFEPDAISPRRLKSAARKARALARYWQSGVNRYWRPMFLDVALERARALCAGLSHVEFARWDILADSPPRTFELTVVMSVLEPFYRRRDLKVAREKMVALTCT